MRRARFAFLREDAYHSALRASGERLCRVATHCRRLGGAVRRGVDVLFQAICTSYVRRGRTPVCMLSPICKS